MKECKSINLKLMMITSLVFILCSDIINARQRRTRMNQISENLLQLLSRLVNLMLYNIN